MVIALQTDPGYKFEIRSYGCMFKDLLAMAEITKGIPLSVSQGNLLWDKCVHKNYLVLNSTGEYIVAAPVEIIIEALKTCDPNAVTNAGNIRSKDYIKNEEWKPWWYKEEHVDFILQKYETRSFYHYVLANKVGTMIYNSYPEVELVKLVEESWYTVS